MSHGRRQWRTRPMVAASVLVLSLTLAAGCQRLAVSRLPDVPFPPDRAPAAAAAAAPPSQTAMPVQGTATATPARAAAAQPMAAVLPLGNPAPASSGQPPVTVAQAQAQSPPAATPQAGAEAAIEAPPLPEVATQVPAPAPALAPAVAAAPAGPGSSASATPMLDAALRRASATPASSGEAPVALTSTAPTVEMEPAPAVSSAEGAAAPSVEPPPFPSVNVVVSEALPPTPPPAESPKVDLQARVAAALVPGRGDVPAMTAAAAPRPIDAEKMPDGARQRALWREGLDRLRSVAAACAAETGGESHDVWALRGQLLAWLDEPESLALPEALGMRQAVLSAVTTLAGPADAPTRAAQLHALVERLEEQAPLEITELRLCRRVMGFGDFEPIEAAACRPGHAVILYCEVAGVHYEPDQAAQRSRLAARAEIVPAHGGAPVWSQTLGTADDLCRHRRRDFYVNYRITLPESLAPGSYQLRLIQDDLVASQTAERGLAFEIGP